MGRAPLSILSLSFSFAYFFFLRHVIVEAGIRGPGLRGPPGKGGFFPEIGAVSSEIIHDVHTHPLTWDFAFKSERPKPLISRVASDLCRRINSRCIVYTARNATLYTNHVACIISITVNYTGYNIANDFSSASRRALSLL